MFWPHGKIKSGAYDDSWKDLGKEIKEGEMRFLTAF